jgi:hypothetical protein
MNPQVPITKPPQGVQITEAMHALADAVGHLTDVVSRLRPCFQRVLRTNVESGPTNQSEQVEKEHVPLAHEIYSQVVLIQESIDYCERLMADSEL